MVRNVYNKRMNQYLMPSSVIAAASACPGLPTAQERDALVKNIRIMQPDAVAVMANGQIMPYQVVVSGNPYNNALLNIPILILNPNEMNEQAVQAQLHNPQNLQRILSSYRVTRKYMPVDQYDPALKMNEAELLEVYCRLADRMKETLPQMLEVLRQAWQGTHDNYPRILAQSEALAEHWDRHDKKHEYKWRSGFWGGVLDGFSLPSMWLADRREAKQAQACAKQMNQAISQGACPPMSDWDREKVERHLRGQLEKLPEFLLRPLSLSGIPVFGAHAIELHARGSVTRGRYNPITVAVSALHDGARYILLEEVLHAVDEQLNFTNSAPMRQAIEQDPLPARLLLDAVISLLVNKAPLFVSDSQYPESIKPAEYLANVCLADQAELTDGQRKEIGIWLHSIFPEQFETDAPFAGELREVLPAILPHGWEQYEKFQEEANREGARLKHDQPRQTVAPAPAVSAIPIRG